MSKVKIQTSNANQKIAIKSMLKPRSKMKQSVLNKKVSAVKQNGNSVLLNNELLLNLIKENDLDSIRKGMAELQKNDKLEEEMGFIVLGFLVKKSE